MNEPRNIAARAGRWSAQHRKKAIFGWLAFVILAFAIGGAVGTNTLENQESGVGESGKASKAEFDAFPKKAEESVLVQSRELKADDPRFVAAVEDVVDRLNETKGVTEVNSPYAAGNFAQISPDKHSALVDFDIPGEPEDTEKAVEEPLATGPRRRRRTPTCGSRSSATPAPTRRSARASRTTSRRRRSPRCRSRCHPGDRLRRARGGGHPAAARALGRGWPRSACSARSARSLPVDESITSVILLIGLAVGVDYSLFYLRREREERAAGAQRGGIAAGGRRHLRPRGARSRASRS